MVHRIIRALFLFIFYRLEEAGVVTECALQTLEAEELLDVNFRGSAIPNKVIIDVCIPLLLFSPFSSLSLKAEGLREAFSELDWSASSIKILLSPEPPYFRAATSTLSGSFEAEYPKDSDVFEAFDCTQTMEHRYK